MWLMEQDFPGRSNWNPFPPTNPQCYSRVLNFVLFDIISGWKIAVLCIEHSMWSLSICSTRIQVRISVYNNFVKCAIHNPSSSVCFSISQYLFVLFVAYTIAGLAIDYMVITQRMFIAHTNLLFIALIYCAHTESIQKWRAQSIVKF